MHNVRKLDLRKLDLTTQCTTILDGLYIQTEYLPVEEQKQLRADVNAMILDFALKHGLTVWQTKAYFYPKLKFNPAHWMDQDQYMTYTGPAAIILKPFVLKGTDPDSPELNGSQEEEGCGHSCGCV